MAKVFIANNRGSSPKSFVSLLKNSGRTSAYFLKRREPYAIQ